MNSYTIIKLRIRFKGGTNEFVLYSWADVLDVLKNNTGGWQVLVRRGRTETATVEISG